MSSRNGGFIDNIDQFDWRAFRIPPREAKYMDPQQRLLLEVAWEAMEDAGLPFEKLAGGRVGVFVATMWNDYLRLQSQNADNLNSYTVTGNVFAFAANRISYTFDLRGPSIAVDSACAGSLASVHIACQSLWMGESSLAIAGGVNLTLSPDASIMLSKAGLLSSEGHCKTLDARADGFVRGEGAGIVVLKPLSQVTSSDRVYALIRGSAVNHNGHNEWIMAASPAGQESVLRETYRVAGIDPAEIDYVELHGTGLPKGDPIEAKVLGEVVGKQPGREHPCIVGSVKSNVGHLESAAGIASIIKVALSLYHKEIPPTIHFQEINPAIHLETLGLAVQKELSPWPDKSGPALAGLTAISLAGVNAHMVLEAPDQVSEDHPPQSGANFPQLLPLSARSPEALLALVQVFKHFLANHESDVDVPLSDILYTASVRRSHHEHRIALIVNSREELATSLDAILQGEFPKGFFSSQIKSDDQEDMHPDLAETIDQCLYQRDAAGTVVPMLPTESKERELVLEALGKLYVEGYTLNWSAIYPDNNRFIQLPTYPWQRERLWLEWLDNQEQTPKQISEPIPDQKSSAEQRGLLQKIKEAPANDRLDLLKAHVREQVTKVLGLDRSYPLESNQRLFDAGLNSLSAVELVNDLQNDLGLPLPATLIFEYPTIEDLSGYLAKEILVLEPITTPNSESQEDSNTQQNKIVSELEKLSEEEAEALLLRKLREARNE
jgi:3-oxoacyl-[acyl-carrier-protein] synthase II